LICITNFFTRHCSVFSWPSNEILPKSFVHGGSQVSVFSVQLNATMENALQEVIDYVTDIKLPTVIKIEEVHKEAIFKALEDFDWKEKQIEVSQKL